MAADQRRRLTTAVASLVLLLVAAVAHPAAPTPPRAKECDPKEIMGQVGKGDLARALAQSEQCVAFARADSARSDEWATLAVLEVGYYLCGNAQLFAMMGDFAKAESALRQAESEAATHSEYGSFLVAEPWLGVVAATRGFILERQGRTAEATAQYASRRDLAPGRQALIALARRDDVVASMWGRIGAISDDPDALIALGTLAELSGDMVVAWISYHDAERLMRQTWERTEDAISAKPRTRSHDFKPMTLAEWSRLQTALARLSKTGPRVTVERGRRRFYDQSGALKAWEKWPRALYSEKVKQQQDAYNSWITAEVRPRPNGVALVPQYPRFFFGSSEENRKTLAQASLGIPYAIAGGVTFTLPERIEPTGVVDRDTLAIPFYRRAYELATLGKGAAIALDDLRPGPTLVNQAASPITRELQDALSLLNQLYHLIQGVTLTTSTGVPYTAWDEVRNYASFATALNTRPLNFDDPPDYVTARLDPWQVTDEFKATMANVEKVAQSHLFLARELLAASPSGNRRD